MTPRVLYYKELKLIREIVKGEQRPRNWLRAIETALDVDSENIISTLLYMTNALEVQNDLRNKMAQMNIEQSFIDTYKRNAEAMLSSMKDEVTSLKKEKAALQRKNASLKGEIRRRDSREFDFWEDAEPPELLQ